MARYMSHHLPRRKMALSEFCWGGQVIHQGFFVLPQPPSSGTVEALPSWFSGFTWALQVVTESLGSTLCRGMWWAFCLRALSLAEVLILFQVGLCQGLVLDLCLKEGLQDLTESLFSLFQERVTLVQAVFLKVPQWLHFSSCEVLSLLTRDSMETLLIARNPHLSLREPLNLQLIILSPSNLYQNGHALLYRSPSCWIVSHILDVRWNCYCRKISSSMPHWVLLFFFR